MGLGGSKLGEREFREEVVKLLTQINDKLKTIVDQGVTAL